MLYKVYNIIYKNTIFINNDFIRFQYMCLRTPLPIFFSNAKMRHAFAKN